MSETCHCRRPLVTRPGDLAATCAECRSLPDYCECALIAPAAAQSADIWENPVPLGSQGIPLPPFPLGALPPWVSAMVTAVAAFCDTPPDVAACAALGAVSAATARRAVVDAKGQKEHVNAYLLSALDSGQRKSSPFKLLAVDPLTAAEQSLQADENARAQMAGPSAEEDARQVRLFTTSATPAGLRDLVTINGERMAVVSAEGGVFEELAGRYTNVPDLDLVLAGYNGEPYHADRATKMVPPLYEPVLTVCLTVQPSVIREMAAKPSFKDRGLLARVLYSLPPDVVGHRQNARTAIPATTSDAYLRGMSGLIARMARSEGRAVWTLSDAAYKIFHEREQQIEPKLARGGEYGGSDGMREWASKFTGHVLKLAGLLHAAEHASHGDTPNRISEETMQNALRLIDYFLAHAEATFGLMRADPRTEDARAVLDWLSRIDWESKSFAGRDPRWVRCREVCQRVWAVRNDVDAAGGALSLLAKHGYVRPVDADRGSPKYLLHPDSSTPSTLRDFEGVSAGQGPDGSVEDRLYASSTLLYGSGAGPGSVEERRGTVEGNLYGSAGLPPAETSFVAPGVEGVEDSGALGSDSWPRDVPATVEDPPYDPWEAERSLTEADQRRQPTPASMPSRRRNDTT